ncbi:MAG: ABC transporter ATP-binding protein, partial [Mycobacterium sp.]|nr:ABC transporter ATP-binding protein [Mycobacterium sp.]
EKLCDTVTIIRAGRTVKSGTLHQMRHLMATTVSARTRGDAQRLREADYVRELEVDDGRVRFAVDRSDLDRAMADLSGLGIEDLTVAPASLEDMFLREYQRAGS